MAAYSKPRRGTIDDSVEVARSAPAATGTRRSSGKRRGAPAEQTHGVGFTSGEGGPDLGRALGPLMREARKRQHMTLQQVAERADLSVSYLSQIERNLLTPSVGTLKRIAAALGIPTGQLIAPDAGAGRARVSVLRREERKRVAFPQSSIRYELLMPDFRRRASALWLFGDPGAESGPEQTHEGEDIVIVLQGQLSISVAGTWHELKAGDSICFNSELPHRWCNRGTRVAQAIWISSPPYL
jgi:transcriptional regulator with XRE-family HTH domain